LRKSYQKNDEEEGRRDSHSDSLKKGMKTSKFRNGIIKYIDNL
jgi:hypothetical protein